MADKKTAAIVQPENILDVRHLKKYFPIRAGLLQHVVGHVRAVDDISFRIKRGTTMGLVGESGCGKTTVGRTLLRLNDKTSGDILFNGQDIHKLNHEELRGLRPKMQIIFQDPYSWRPAACKLTTGTAIPTSFPAASASASASPGPWRLIRNSSYVTSLYPHWMCPYRRRLSTCSRSFSRNTACPTYSSATICPSWSILPIPSVLCTWAA